MSVCGPQYYTWLAQKRTKISDSSVSYKIYVYDKVNKSLFAAPGFQPTLDSDYFPLNNGSVIDVFQAALGGQTRVYAAVVDYSQSGYTKLITLASTSGDLYNELLTASYAAGVLTVKMYARIVKEVTTLTFSMQTGYTLPISGMPAASTDGTYNYEFVGSTGSGTFANTPCINNYSNPKTSAGNPIETYCQGYDKYTVYHNGAGGVTEEIEANSTYCGWVNPGDGGGGGESPPLPLVARITELKLIKVNNSCFQNPIYLVWRNRLGGWDYWLFEKMQQFFIDTESLGTFKENFDSIADTTNPNWEIGKSARRRIVLGAQGLEPQEKTAILEVLLSPCVYIINSDLTVDRRVNIASGSFQEKKTDNNLEDIEFEIIDSEIITLRN